MDKLATFYRRSRKTIAALAGAAVAWGQLVIQSEPEQITGPEWMVLVVGVLTALGVYGATNEPEG